jgi:hypothetical protein
LSGQSGYQPIKLPTAVVQQPEVMQYQPQRARSGKVNLRSSSFAILVFFVVKN